MPNKAKPSHYKPLYQVVTLAEAARLSYRHEQTLRYAIDAGNLAAVKVGRIWLVSIESLNEAFPVEKKRG